MTWLNAQIVTLIIPVISVDFLTVDGHFAFIIPKNDRVYQQSYLNSIYSMNILIWLLVIFTEILLIEPICSVNNTIDDVNKNQTIHEPDGSRFQRILRRKKRFLLFPPGAAIVVIFL